MRAHVAVDTQIMRGINTSAVLSVLRAEGRMSVSALAERTGLSRQAVTRSLNSLEFASLVVFVPPDATEPRSGRPAQLVSFRAEAGHVIGMSLTPRDVRLVLADLAGTFILERTEAIGEGVDALAVLTRAVTEALEQSRLAPSDIWGVSVASPGIVDPDGGLVRFVPSMSGLEGDVIVRELGLTLDCPVLLDNDLNLATEGEQWRGVSHDVSSMVLIEWGERVGAGVVLNGALYRGASNDAGDLGFLDLAVMPTDTATSTPGLGAFERWVGGAQLVALTLSRARSRGDDELLAELQDGDAFAAALRAVQRGNESAVEAVTEIASRFAVGLAAVRSLLDPQLVILGGPMARCGDVLLEALSNALAGQVLNQPVLEISSLGDDAVLHGAIHRALAHVEDLHFSFSTVTETVTSQARQHQTIN